LVISTTNRATDAVAIALGDAAKVVCPNELLNGNLLRLGKGAALPLFQEQDLGMMLRGTEAEILMKITKVAERLLQAEDWEDKAFARKQIAGLRGASDQSGRLFVDANVRVVVSTAFKAMTCLKAPVVSSMLAQGEAPFTTIFIDAAGLRSRAANAALSYLAARRVVLVGDSK
jgi:hypothetical protein